MEIVKDAINREKELQAFFDAEKRQNDAEDTKLEFNRNILAHHSELHGNRADRRKQAAIARKAKKGGVSNG